MSATADTPAAARLAGRDSTRDAMRASTRLRLATARLDLGDENLAWIVRSGQDDGSLQLVVAAHHMDPRRPSAAAREHLRRPDDPELAAEWDRERTDELIAALCRAQSPDEPRGMAAAARAAGLPWSDEGTSAGGDDLHGAWEDRESAPGGDPRGHGYCYTITESWVEWSAAQVAAAEAAREAAAEAGEPGRTPPPSAPEALASLAAASAFPPARISGDDRLSLAVDHQARASGADGDGAREIAVRAGIVMDPPAAAPASTLLSLEADVLLPVIRAAGLAHPDFPPPGGGGKLPAGQTWARANRGLEVDPVLLETDPPAPPATTEGGRIWVEWTWEIPAPTPEERQRAKEAALQDLRDDSAKRARHDWREALRFAIEDYEARLDGRPLEGGDPAHLGDVGREIRIGDALEEAEERGGMGAPGDPALRGDWQVDVAHIIAAWMARAATERRIDTISGSPVVVSREDWTEGAIWRETEYLLDYYETPGEVRAVRLAVCDDDETEQLRAELAAAAADEEDA